MSASVRSFLFGPLLAYAGKLRFPRLLALTELAQHSVRCRIRRGGDGHAAFLAPGAGKAKKSGPFRANCGWRTNYHHDS